MIIFNSYVELPEGTWVLGIIGLSWIIHLPGSLTEVPTMDQNNPQCSWLEKNLCNHLPTVSNFIQPFWGIQTAIFGATARPRNLFENPIPGGPSREHRKFNMELFPTLDWPKKANSGFRRSSTGHWPRRKRSRGKNTTIFCLKVTLVNCWCKIFQIFQISCHRSVSLW